MKPGLRIFILLSFFMFCFSGLVNAFTYYVSNAGNDGNSGLSLAQAFETLQHAADIVVAGDLVLIENGTYTGFDLRNKNGTAANPIVFQCLGNNVIINSSGPIRDDGINIENADYITLDGFNVFGMTGSGNGIRLVLSDFCIVRNCWCDNNAERGIFTGFTDDILIEYNTCSNSVDEHGIYVSNSSDRPVIRYNECYGNNNIGIHMNGDLSAGEDGIIHDAQVYGNHIHDNNLAAGINMDGVLNALVYNNLIYNNHFSQGIALFQQDGAVPTSGVKIFNNTIIVPSDGRWGVLVRSGSNVNTEIYNNIILNEHAWRGCIAIENGTGFMSNHNIVNDKMSDSGDGSTITFNAWQVLGYDLNSQLANAQNLIFTNPAINDYSLVSGSQAIDTGTSIVSPPVSDDFSGKARPLGLDFDIGAYEYDAIVAIEILTRLKAVNHLDHVSIHWSSISTGKDDVFRVEKSKNSKDWKRLRDINAGNQLMIENSYEVIDFDPYEGAYFYRLVDPLNNKLLDMISHQRKHQPNLKLYPNPVKDILFIDANSLMYETHQINLYNSKGALLKTWSAINKLDVSGFQPGNYSLVIIFKNGSRSVEKFIVY